MSWVICQMYRRETVTKIWNSCCKYWSNIDTNMVSILLIFGSIRPPLAETKCGKLTLQLHIAICDGSSQFTTLCFDLFAFILCMSVTVATLWIKESQHGQTDHICLQYIMLRICLINWICLKLNLGLAVWNKASMKKKKNENSSFTCFLNSKLHE